MIDGRKLRARREERGLTQSQVAALIGKAQAQVSEVELCKSYASPAVARLIDDALWREERAAEAEQMQREQERIASQEAAWNAVPDGPEKQALLAALLDRAYDLMNEGDGTQTDAIVEFLPKADVTAMFERWERECMYPHAATVMAPDVSNPAAIDTRPGTD